MKKIAVIACVSLMLAGFAGPAREMPTISSTSTRIHYRIDATCSVGTLDIPAWGNPDYPLFDSIPKVRLGLVSLVPGTTLYGAGLAKLLQPKGFYDFMRYYSPSLHMITVGEEYGFFSGGQEKTAGFVYSAIANAGITPEQAKSTIETNLIENRADWTMPGSFRNFDWIKVFAKPNDLNLKSMLYDLQKCATGETLARISQTMVPLDGYLDKPADLEMTQPYTTIPVIDAQDQYLDFMMRPVGTAYDSNGASSTTSEAVTYVRSKVKLVEPDNVKVVEGFDNIKDVTAGLKVKYANEFRFQFEVDPPVLSGVTMLPLSPTKLGVTTLYAKDGSIHKVQSTKAIDSLYKWLPQTETAFGKELFMVPAVKERVLDDRTYWQLSHFRLFYPQAKFENGIRFVEQAYTDIDPCRVEEISGERFGYLNVTNFPEFENAKNTAFIEKIDRPFRLVAIYEPSELAPRGSGVSAGSTRVKLSWNVTSEMKELARKKSQEDGENWWKGSFPTFYTINLKGDATKKIEKVNPLQDSVMFDGLKPGGKYYWEIETWVSDEWGSSGLKNTWKSDYFQTKPMPMLVGQCVQTSAIKIETEVDSENEENWVITVPTVYELGNVKLKPLKFSTIDRTRNKITSIEGTTGVKVTEEVVNNRKVIRCRLQISKVYDLHDKNNQNQTVIYVEFQPMQVKVIGDCVDEYGNVIGKVEGTAGTWWPAADGPGVESPLRTVEAPLLIKGKKLWKFSKWNWVGSIVATRMPYTDGERGVSILVCKANGCQPDPEKPLDPKFYAQYEEIPVDCFAVGVGFTVNWKPIAIKGKIPMSPEPDCPGDGGKYMAGTKVTIGPAPETVTVEGTNYTFVGWIVGQQAYPGLKKVTVTMNGGVTVYANYQPSGGRFQLSWYADIDGRRTKLEIKVSPKPDADGLYPAGTMIRIGPVPLSLDNGKYVLTGWAIDGKLDPKSATSTSLEMMMDDNHRVALIYELSR